MKQNIKHTWLSQKDENNGFINAIAVNAGKTIVCDFCMSTGSYTSRPGTDSPTIYWEGAEDSGSGISHYEVSIGTSQGDDDIQAWTVIKDSSEVSFSNLNFNPSVVYFANVRAVDFAGNVGETHRDHAPHPFLRPHP